MLSIIETSLPLLINLLNNILIVGHHNLGINDSVFL